MMRHHLTRVALLFGLILAVGACDEGLTDLNDNPNQPTDVPVEYLLAQSIQSGVQLTFGGSLFMSHTAIWPQHFVQIQYPDEETGYVRASRMEFYWTSLYAGSLKDIQTVIDKAAESGDTNVEAVGRIWKTWLFHIVTDLWGDVPYTEALLGEDNSAPAYDTQQDIYAAMLAELTTAVGMLSGSSIGVGAGDLFFGDDVDAWRRFANSLRMRLAMRLTNVDMTTAENEFMAAYNTGQYISSNAENVVLEYPGSPYQNPLYENWLSRDDHGVSATMIDTLQVLNDPRLPLYAEPAAEDGVFRGHENGRDDLPEGQSLAWFSRINDFWRANGAETPTVVFSYAEVAFLIAEAAAHGWGVTEGAAAIYRDGIEASMTVYEPYGHAPSAAEIATYMAQPEVAYADVNSTYLQKWIALWMNGAEAYADWRRTGVPNLVAGPDLVTNLGMIPVRFIYPDSEQSLNSENLQTALDRQNGGLDLVTPLWWEG